MDEKRYWKKVEERLTPFSVKPIYRGIRNDGQHFVAHEENYLNTFLDPKCICAIPRPKEVCPVHSKHQDDKNIVDYEPDWA